MEWAEGGLHGLEWGEEEGGLRLAASAESMLHSFAQSSFISPCDLHQQYHWPRSM